MVNNPLLAKPLPLAGQDATLQFRLLFSNDCDVSLRKGRLIIGNGPVYSLAVAQDILRNNPLFVINEKARDSMARDFSPELTDEGLTEFILNLVDTDFEGSERCETSIGRTVDCDGYAMQWNRFSKQRWSDAPWIYVKFGFIADRPKLLVISIHPSKVYSSKK